MIQSQLKFSDYRMVREFHTKFEQRYVKRDSTLQCKQQYKKNLYSHNLKIKNTKLKKKNA